MKIAVLGPAGTFSDVACSEYNNSVIANNGKGYDPLYCSTIDDVFKSVCDDELCDVGIVPIENTLDGYVQRTLDLLLEKKVEIISENIVPVRFSLITNVDDINKMEKLFVQFKANGQCRKFIRFLENVTIVTTDSNMESFYKVNDNENSGAIVPCHVMKDHKGGYSIADVTDAKSNFTRFIIFRRNDCSKVEKPTVENGKPLRIPAYIMPNTDRPGILFEILECFYKKQINLISIMSRPTKQAMGTYNFYIEIESDNEKLDEIKNAIEFIRQSNEVKLLGIFEKV